MNTHLWEHYTHHTTYKHTPPTLTWLNSADTTTTLAEFSPPVTVINNTSCTISVVGGFLEGLAAGAVIDIPYHHHPVVCSGTLKCHSPEWKAVLREKP